VSALPLAVALAVASATVYALAAVTQERLAARLDSGHPSPRPIRSLAVSQRWWISVSLNAIGGALHVAALAYGPLSVVQPLGVMTLVLALPIGAALTARRVSVRQWRGAGITVTGLVLLLLLTTPTGGRPLARDSTAILITVAGAPLLAAIAGGWLIRRTVPRSLLYATAAGVAFAVGSALTHSLTRQFGETGIRALLSPVTVAVAVMAVTGVLLSQFAYRGSGLGAPLATVALANPVTSAMIGLTLLGERFAGGPIGTSLVIAAGVTACWGIILLVQAATPTGPPPEIGTVDAVGRRPMVCGH